MRPHWILSAYIEGALARAEYEELEDASYGGRIPGCPGVIAFADTLAGCQDVLRSTLEDWILVGLKLGHELPVIDGIDLNQHPEHEPLEAL